MTLKSVNSTLWSREREPLFDGRCGVGVSEAEKFFCWMLIRHGCCCQFLCHFVHFLSTSETPTPHLPSKTVDYFSSKFGNLAYVSMADELVNCQTVDKNHNQAS